MYKVKYYKYLQKGGAILDDDLLIGIFDYLIHDECLEIVNQIDFKHRVNDFKNKDYLNAVKKGYANEWKEYYIEPLKNVMFLLEHNSNVTSVCWSNDNRICSGSNDNTLRIWDAESGNNLMVFEYTGDGEVNSVCWSNDNLNRICSGVGGFLEGELQVWDANSGELIRNIYVFDDDIPIEVTSVCWSPTGNRICSVGDFTDKKIRVWDTESGQCLMMLEGHNSFVTSVCWSTDGSNRICSGSNDNTVRVWDANNVSTTYDDCLITLIGHNGCVNSVYWSPTGNRICSGSNDYTVRVWDADSSSATYGQCLTVLEGHTRKVTSVCWSNDGTNRICSGSYDRTLRVWDAESGLCLVVLNKHAHWVNSVCWSNDGSNRICSGGSGGLHIINQLPGQVLVWGVSNNYITSPKRRRTKY